MKFATSWESWKLDVLGILPLVEKHVACRSQDEVTTQTMYECAPTHKVVIVVFL